MTENNECKSILKILHGGPLVGKGSGLLSCCNVKLYEIITYINKYHQLPSIVDSSEQFLLYKKNIEDDLTYSYFSHPNNISINIQYDKHIDFHFKYQFNIKNLDFTHILPVFKKYFTVSDEITYNVSYIEEKYHLKYNNICVLFYRGNDKITETIIKSYGDVIEKAMEIKRCHPDIQFLIQTDEIEFVEECLKHFPESIIFYDEVRMINKSLTSVDKCMPNNFYYSKLFLSIVIIMSRCKFVITGSLGNIPLFICLYRGNTDNFIF